jgi:hypothetical protein
MSAADPFASKRPGHHGSCVWLAGCVFLQMKTRLTACKACSPKLVAEHLFLVLLNMSGHFLGSLLAQLLPDMLQRLLSTKFLPPRGRGQLPWGSNAAGSYPANESLNSKRRDRKPLQLLRVQINVPLSQGKRSDD